MDSSKRTDNDASFADTLSDRQKLLLERYYDGECTFVSRFFVERFLKSNADAQEYISLLEHSSECLNISASEKEALFYDSKSDGELWAAIEQRIEAEERASIFLGNRELQPATASSGERSGAFGLLEKIFPVNEGRVGEGWWSSSFGVGGAVAFSILAVIGVTQYFSVGNFSVGTPDGPSQTPRMAASGGAPSMLSVRGDEEGSSDEIRITASNPVPVELVSSRIDGPSPRLRGERGVPLTADTFDRFAFDDLFSPMPQIEFRRAPQQRPQGQQPLFVSRNSAPSVEVDWMKSDGRVRILSGPQAKAPIIFVKKRKPISALRQDSHFSRLSDSGVPNSRGIVLQENVVPSATFAKR